MDDPVLDSRQAINFLRKLFPSGPWCLTTLTPTAKKAECTKTFGPDTEDAARNFIENAHGQRNCYFHVNPVMGAVSKKADRTEIKEVARLHVDIDVNPGRTKEDILRLLTKDLPKGIPEPTLIVDSGNGVNAYWQLNSPIPINGNIGLAEDAARYNQQLEHLLGGDHCHDVSRIMRLPFTLNIPDPKKTERGCVRAPARVLQHKLENVYPLSEFKQASAPVPKQAVVVGVEVDVGTTVRRLTSMDELDQYLKDASKQPLLDHVKVVAVQGKHPDKPKSGDNSRSAWLHDACCNLVRCGVPDSIIFSIITDPECGISESVLEFKDKAQGYAMRQILRAKEKVAADVAEFQTTEKGVPYPNQHNIRVALAKLGVRVRHDQFADRLLIEGLPGHGPTLQDEGVASLYLQTDARFGFKASKEFFWMVVEDEARQHGFHPIKDYLDGLEWDGTPRVDTWLTTYGGAESTEYTRAVGALVLIAAVRRIRQPGCKFDEMLVLRSPQGSMKSTALATLVPDPDYFTDDLPLGADTKVIIERLHGRWIVEAAELKGMRNSDFESLKAFLSRGVDRARMAYGHITKEVRRQCIIIGTTNSDKFLRDPTGNRRFWPVEVKLFDIAALHRDRDQLWAEASQREANGASIRLDPSLYGAAAERQEEHRVEDPFVELLGRKLGELQGKILSADLWDLLNIAGAQRNGEHGQRIGKAMQDLGWERTKLRFEGPVGWCYWRGNKLDRIWVRRDGDGVMRATKQDPDARDEDGLPE